MCLLTYFPPGQLPDLKRLATGAEGNPDGHGWAIVTGREILTGWDMDADKAIAEFARLRGEYPDWAALFHSRIATHGGVDLTNCHPFVVGNDPRTIIAHNGILPTSAQPGKDDDRSDTRILAEDMIPKFRFGHLRKERNRRRFEAWLGYHNKVVMLTIDPKYPFHGHIFNEDCGDWVEGVWYSNDSHDETQWSIQRAYRIAQPVWSSSVNGWISGRQGTYAGGGIEGATGWPTTIGARECNICFVPNVVGTDNICSECNVCQVCEEWAPDCLCHAPMVLSRSWPCPQDPSCLWRGYSAYGASEHARDVHGKELTVFDVLGTPAHLTMPPPVGHTKARHAACEQPWDECTCFGTEAELNRFLDEQFPVTVTKSTAWAAGEELVDDNEEE